MRCDSQRGVVHPSVPGEGFSRAASSGNNGDKGLSLLRAPSSLAGGRGTPLAPYTSVFPKPLMPIGDRAILEVVVEQLTAHGITDITLCVGYLSHLIQTLFGNRENGHVSINYVREPKSLGTAGPLGLVVASTRRSSL
jgi:hypothetical protein